MINQVELKTLIPSVVASGILIYESITGNQISSAAADGLTNGFLIGASSIVTLVGVFLSHKKKPQPKVEAPQPTVIRDETTK